MKKLLAIVLSLLMVFAAIPMAMVSADTMTATHVYTMDEGNRITAGQTRYHWGRGFADIGGDHGYVYRSETKSDAYAYFKLPAGWSTDYGKVTKISFELGGATKGYFYNPGFILATGVDSNLKYTGAVRGIWKDVSWTAGSWTTVEIDVSDKDTFIIDGTEARYMCLGAQKSLGVQNSSDSAKGWFYIDNVTLTYEYEANLPEYDVTIDGEVVETVMETKKFTVPTPAEGYHYSDGTNDYFGGEEITVTGPVALTSVINSYDVTVDGTFNASVAHGSTYTVPAPATGYQYSDGANLYDGGEEITVTGPVALTSVVATTSYVYTMDEGSRIVSGYTSSCNPSDGVFEEVNGNWVFKLPSKADQPAHFTLPEDWYEKPYYKATSVSFSISKTAGAASGTEYVEFTDGKNVVKISNAHTGLKDKYTVDVDESLYGYRTFQMKLKGGSNFVEAKDYIYIDDVTVNFEYDFDYVADTEGLVSTDARASIRLNEKPGIRFYTKIDWDAVNALNVNNEEITIGTLIAPADYITDELTHELGKAFLDVEYTAKTYWGTGDEFVGSILSVKDKNLGRDFVGRGYVKIGDTYYYSDAVSTRSVKTVANAYISESPEYAGLDENMKVLVDGWAAVADWSAQ